MATKTGFIAPPWPHVRGDSVSAASLISRIEKEAHRGCGLYYEIYNYRALSQLMDVLTNLSAGDVATFSEIAERRGFHLSLDALDEAYETYLTLQSKIRRDQE